MAAVISGKLSAAKSWTYTLEQGGDYQLGTSWVELLSDGEVDVSITINGKQVKGLRASKDSSAHGSLIRGLWSVPLREPV